MTRITKEWLKSRVQTLNMLLERPMTIFSPGASASEQNIGHLSLDKDEGGYRLVEIVSGGGAEANWAHAYNPRIWIFSSTVLSRALLCVMPT